MKQAMILVAMLALASAGPAGAQQTEIPQDAAPETMAAARGLPGRGAETNLPIPRFVSLKTSEGNVRRGPSLSHRIDWVFKRRDMPLQVVAEYGNWRRVEDRDGVGGWIHYTLLSGVRTVLIEAEMAELRARPDPKATVVARAEAGVIARLGACNPTWCEISADGETGWVEKSTIWGVDPDETRE